MTNLQSSRLSYTNARNTVNNLVKKRKSLYYRHKLQNANSKDMFDIVSALIKPQEENLPNYVSIEDGCTQFADFFCNKIKRLLITLDGESICTEETSLCTEPLLAFRECNVKEVVQLIKATSKTCALDPLPSSVLSQCVDALAPLITNIINMSIAQSDIPELLKESVVRPLLKKPSLDVDVLSNYKHSQ